jgi:acetolactate synthase-1/2/3 large subunit
MTGAELLVKCLEREGVEYIFGIPGEETLYLNDALRDSKIRFITVRHEQGAAFMADVYGRRVW